MMNVPMLVGETTRATQTLLQMRSRYEPVSTQPSLSHIEGSRLISESLASGGSVGEVSARAINIQIRKQDDFVEMVRAFRF